MRIRHKVIVRRKNDEIVPSFRPTEDQLTEDYASTGRRCSIGVAIEDTGHCVDIPVTPARLDEIDVGQRLLLTLERG